MGSCGEDLTWSLADGVLTISGSGDMLEYSDGAFPGWYGKREEIREIVLPSKLTSISDFAFFGCNNVTSVTIPSSVTRIGEYAFAQCTQLLQVDLGTGVESIGDGAFQECEALSSITFPASLTEIGSKAFYRCYGIQILTIPETVTNMGSSVFAYCTGLVRATVNAPLNELPDWTFYGCESLTDVSLAPFISSVGELAFQNCENLNGIYTQGGDLNTAHELKKSISKTEGSPSEGIVGIYDMPEISVVTKDDGEVYSETKVTQLENTVVSVKNETDYSGEQSKTNTIISATVNKSEDWAEIAQIVDETIASARSLPITVKIQLIGTTVEGENLALFAGKSVIVQITAGSGVIWKIDMSEMTADSFSGSYDLSVTVSETDAEKTTIESENVYCVEFSDSMKFNTTLGIKVGQSYDLATLYQKSGGEYAAIDTIVVDNDNIAWYALANIDKGTDYYIGLNVEGLTTEDAVIPQTMYEQYGLDDESYLMDKDGVKYQITGRSSKWGITGKQFASYVAVFLCAVVLIVAIVMISLNHIKKLREQYENFAKKDEADKAAEDIDEEALRMEIMRELLEEHRDDVKKD